MSKIIFNNQILNKEELSISLENRAFLYGDGLFESVKIFNGKAFNLDAHLERIFSGAQFLNLDVNMSKEDLRNQISCLLKENEIINSAYLKIILFRNQGGRYLPDSNQSSCLIFSVKDKQNQFELNKYGLELGLFRAQLKSVGRLSNFKTISALQSVLCANEARKQDKDDCLMFNTRDNLIESANSNLFYVKDNMIYTPKLSEGCVDGTMRSLIINFKNLTFQIHETILELDELLNADEVFLTNAIQGVRWVARIEDRLLDQQNISKYLVKQINQLI